MKKDKKQAIIDMTASEMNKRVSEIIVSIADNKMQLMIGKLKNVHVMKMLKKELALIKTIETQRKNLNG